MNDCPSYLAIEAALVDAFRQQGADIQADEFKLVARCYAFDVVGPDDGPGIAFVDITRMASDLERRFAS